MNDQRARVLDHRFGGEHLRLDSLARPRRILCGFVLLRTARALRDSHAQDPGDAEVSPSPWASFLLLELGVRYIWHTTQQRQSEKCRSHLTRVKMAPYTMCAQTFPNPPAPPCFAELLLLCCSAALPRCELLNVLLRYRSDYLNDLVHDDWSEHIDDLLNNALLLKNKDGCVLDDPGQDRDLFCRCSRDTFGTFLPN